LCSAGYEVTYTAAYTFGRKPLYPVLVVKQVHVERSMAFEDPDRWLGREVDLAGMR